MNDQEQNSTSAPDRNTSPVFPDPENFAATLQGKPVWLLSLINKNGCRADITNYGGRIVSLAVPDKHGVFDDVVAGFHSLDAYLNSTEAFFGALIGRYANRIAGGKFVLDGVSYSLAVNNGPNHLHGGPGGFHNMVWDMKQVTPQQAELTCLSPHMHEGYPGNLELLVRYTLNDQNELHIEFRAETDQRTVVNFTAHPFFNLSGEGDQSINDHILKIRATHFTPTDQFMIPTGEVRPVEQTPMDFTGFMPIGERLNSPYDQLKFAGGYDHNYVLIKRQGHQHPEPAASVYDPVSGRVLEVLTTEPGLQFYGGNFLNGENTGKRGKPYHKRTSFCLEPQHFPDSPNQPDFPSTLLNPGEIFTSHSVFRFSVSDHPYPDTESSGAIMNQ